MIRSRYITLFIVIVLSFSMAITLTWAQEPTPTANLSEALLAAADVVSLGLTGQIAYPAFDAERNTFDTYLANADGTGRTVLVTEASAPDLRTDGEFIAFRSWNPEERGLFAQKTSGEFRRILTAQAFAGDVSPAWSPDGESIAFSARREPDSQSRLYLAWPGGTTDWVVITNGAEAIGDTPDWLSPGRIVFSGCVDDECGLAAMNEDGTGASVLTNHPSDRAPEVSPDGTEMVFMSQRDGNWDIYWVPARGGKPMRLTDDPAQDGLPAWSPGGQYVAFVSDRGGQWAIWLIKPNGSEQQPLFILEGPLQSNLPGQSWLDENISWIPDSSGATVAATPAAGGQTAVPSLFGAEGDPCNITLLEPEPVQSGEGESVARFRWQMDRSLAADEYYLLFLGGMIDGKPHLKGSFKDVITDETGPWPLDVLETLIPFMGLEELREPAYETTVPATDDGQLHWEIQVRKTGRKGLTPSPIDIVVCKADAEFALTATNP